MEKMIAYCGLNCAECGAYLAMKSNDQALREKIAAEWTQAYGVEITPDMINCSGCKGDGVQFSRCSNCEFRSCAIEKGVENCGECAEFKTCKIINDFIAEVPEALENLA